MPACLRTAHLHCRTPAPRTSLTCTPTHLHSHPHLHSRTPALPHPRTLTHLHPHRLAPRTLTHMHPAPSHACTPLSHPHTPARQHSRTAARRCTSHAAQRGFSTGRERVTAAAQPSSGPFRRRGGGTPSFPGRSRPLRGRRGRTKQPWGRDEETPAPPPSRTFGAGLGSE